MMHEPKIILVATDFGEPSEAALETAIEYAKVFGSEIVLMHAFEIPIVGFPDGAVLATAELMDRILEGAQAGLDRQIKNHEGCGVAIRGVIKQGDPYRMVNDAAEEVGAGLIAIGTHGRKGLSRALIGSVAEKVVRTARVPVLTVHPSEVMKGEDSRPAARQGITEDVSAQPETSQAAPASTRTVRNGSDVQAPLSHR
jgi:nucleotide-binding universal stress UspA family protein